MPVLPPRRKYNNLLNREIVKFLKCKLDIVYIDNYKLYNTDMFIKHLKKMISSLTLVEKTEYIYKIMQKKSNNIDTNNVDIEIVNDDINIFLTDNNDFYNFYYLDFNKCFEDTTNKIPWSIIDTILKNQINSRLVIFLSFSLYNLNIIKNIRNCIIFNGYTIYKIKKRTHKKYSEHGYNMTILLLLEKDS